MVNRIVDITVHIDETLDPPSRQALAQRLQGEEGVVKAAYSEDAPHLMIVEYDADRLDSSALLGLVQRQGVHAELIGL